MINIEALVLPYRHSVMAYEVEDLYQEARLALHEAKLNFDGDVESERFDTYATKCIKGAIMALILQGDSCSVATSTRYQYNQIFKMRDELSRKLGRPATVAEIAKACDTTERTVMNAFNNETLLAPAQRLNAPVDEDGNTSEKFLTDSTSLSLEESFEKKQAIEFLHKAINGLDNLHKACAKLLLAEKSTAEIASYFGYTDRKARELVKETLSLLKQNKELAEAI